MELLRGIAEAESRENDELAAQRRDLDRRRNLVEKQIAQKKQKDERLMKKVQRFCSTVHYILCSCLPCRQRRIYRLSNWCKSQRSKLQARLARNPRRQAKRRFPILVSRPSAWSSSAQPQALAAQRVSDFVRRRLMAICVICTRSVLLLPQFLSRGERSETMGAWGRVKSARSFVAEHVTVCHFSKCTVRCAALPQLVERSVGRARQINLQLATASAFLMSHNCKARGHNLLRNRKVLNAPGATRSLIICCDVCSHALRIRLCTASKVTFEHALWLPNYWRQADGRQVLLRNQWA